MKLMDIDQEHLGIPDTQYDATITFSSTEFARICRDLSALGESVKIEVDKQGIRFSSDGEIGNGSVLLKHSAGRGNQPAQPASRVKKETKPKVKKEAKRDPDDEDEEGSEPEVTNVDSDEEDVKPEVDEEEEEKPEVDEDDENFEPQVEEEAEGKAKKRKAGAAAKKEPNGRAKKVSCPCIGETMTDIVSGKGHRGRRRGRRQHHSATISLPHVLPQVPPQLCQVGAALENSYAKYEQRSTATRGIRIRAGTHQLLLGPEGE